MSPKGPVSIRHFCLYRLMSGVGLAVTLTIFAQGAFAKTQASAALPAVITISVTPNVATVGSKKKVNFHAIVTNTTNKIVTWSASVGTITTTGAYTAPSVVTNTTVVVTAISAADITKKSSASVTVTPALKINTVSIPGVNVNTSYSAAITASAGWPPFSWSVSSGSLPGGLTINSLTGVISGKPTQVGGFSFTVEVKDSSYPTQQSATLATVANVQPVGTAVQSNFFNMSVNLKTSPWPTTMGANLGGVRLLTASMEWADINTADGVYDWSIFDIWMAKAQANGQDVMFTIYQTPSWASSNTSAVCVKVGGGCAPPRDLNADGTGTNQYFKDFVSALIKHAGAGKIKYLEVWNEANITTEWTGTQAQLVRMAQDASAVAKAIDSKILVGTPSETGDGSGLQMNFLAGFLAAGGGQYVDFLTFHGYLSIAEDIAIRIDNLRGVATTYGQGNKPVFDSEGSWGAASKMTDPDAEAAFTARHYLIQIAKLVNRFYYFGWDMHGTGDLYDYTSGKLTLAGIAYKQIYQWTVGAVPQGPCTASGTVWSCAFTRSNGYKSLAVWDTAQSCKKSICTTSLYAVPTQYIQYRDINGNLNPVTGTYTSIGAKPIFLENMSAW
jgi:putative Ig domain-containing protein/cellulase (glycosyl hydrolase family 5)